MTAVELVGGPSDGLVCELVIIETVPVFTTRDTPVVVFQPGLVPAHPEGSSALLCYWYAPEPYRARRGGMPIRLHVQPLHPAQGAP